MGTGDQARILIVDDHPLFREALEVALMKAIGDMPAVEHCGTLDAACQSVRRELPMLVLLDLNLSDSRGFDGLLKLQAIDTSVPVTVVSATESADAYDTARRLGARGYLPKSVGLETLASALRLILDGERWFPPSDPVERATDGSVDSTERVASLTPAQRRVLDGLSEGLLNKQIAYDMGISEATVKAHMTAIFRKLSVNNRTQALLMLKSVTAVDDHSAA
ncbi:MAG: response regulator transcription factor [Pseudomonadota bacterium]